MYACDTLDTMYVRPCARRQGYSLALLRTLTSELPPGDHLGLSHPVSLSMCKGKGEGCEGEMGVGEIGEDGEGGEGRVWRWISMT